MSGVRLGNRFLARGESLVAALGVHGVLILLGVVGASWWWTAHTHRETLVQERVRQVESTGTVAARAIEGLLAAGDLSGVRCVVADLGLRTGAEECVLEAPGGGVLAASDPALISVRELPTAWAAGAVADEGVELSGGELRGTWSIVAAPGSAGVLRVRGVVSYPLWTNWEVQAGGAAAAVGGLAAFLLLYHRVRVRMRALGAVGEALACAGAGERSRETLEVSESFGPVASAWNSILLELERLRAVAAVERSAAAGGGGARRREETLGEACDAMWHGLLVVDESLRVRYANGAAATFLGVERESLSGAAVGECVRFPAVVEALGGVAGGGVRVRSVVEVEPEDGRGAVLRCSVRPLRKSDAMAAMVLIEDVTQQRMADRSRNSFVAQATHELRTPLTNIRLYVEALLERDEADAAERARCLNVVNGEVRRLERIVGDMLSVSELEAGSLALSHDDVRLETLFEELEQDFRMQAREKGVTVSFRLPPKLPVIKGDRDKLTMALGNVIGNALKYTASGGEVTVTVGVTGGMVSVEVADTGIGISEEDAGRVFEKFYRAQDKRLAGIAGSGLGLPLARQVARMHGGDITLSSVINKGSTFTLTVPAAAPVSLAA